MLIYKIVERLNQKLDRPLGIQRGYSSNSINKQKPGKRYRKTSKLDVNLILQKIKFVWFVLQIIHLKMYNVKNIK